MGATTSIEWTDASANFWRGCHKVTPGCSECYMFRDQLRYGRDPSIVVRCSPATFYAPLRSKRWRDRAAAIADTEGRRMRVFTCSWSDFFIEDADPWRDDAWAVIRACPQYDWQILTKRPELIADRLPDDWGDGWPHVWLGVSIENRRFVDRADLLLETPAVVRFVSAEPLLGPLVYPTDLGTVRERADVAGWDERFAGDPYEPCWEDGSTAPQLDLTGIDWLIVGGESGGRKGRRLVEESPGGWMPTGRALAWVRELRDACVMACSCSTLAVEGGAQHAHRPAFFFKQWGGPRPDSGGRELDGRTWDEFPMAATAVAA